MLFSFLAVWVFCSLTSLTHTFFFGFAFCFFFMFSFLRFLPETSHTCGHSDPRFYEYYKNGTIMVLFGSEYPMSGSKLSFQWYDKALNGKQLRDFKLLGDKFKDPRKKDPNARVDLNISQYNVPAKYDFAPFNEKYERDEALTKSDCQNHLFPVAKESVYYQYPIENYSK